MTEIQKLADRAKDDLKHEINKHMSESELDILIKDIARIHTPVIEYKLLSMAQEHTDLATQKPKTKQSASTSAIRMIQRNIHEYITAQLFNALHTA